MFLPKYTYYPPKLIHVAKIGKFVAESGKAAVDTLSVPKEFEKPVSETVP